MIVRGIRTCCLRAPFVEPPRWSRSHDRPRGIFVWMGQMGVALFCLSAIGIALGKRAGLPPHRLGVSCRIEIPIYGSGCTR